MLVIAFYSAQDQAWSLALPRLAQPSAAEFSGTTAEQSSSTYMLTAVSAVIAGAVLTAYLGSPLSLDLGADPTMDITAGCFVAARSLVVSGSIVGTALAFRLPSASACHSRASRWAHSTWIFLLVSCWLLPPLDRQQANKYWHSEIAAFKQQ